MAEKKIITIGRQFGSGGKQIGEALAEKMNIPFYDKELLKEAAKNSGICEEIFDSFDEKPTNSFLYSLVMDPYSLGVGSSTFSLRHLTPSRILQRKMVHVYLSADVLITH